MPYGAAASAVLGVGVMDIQVNNIDYDFAMDEQSVAVVSFKVSYGATDLPLVGEFTVNTVVARKGDQDAMVNDARVALHRMSLDLLKHTSAWAS